MSLLTQAVTRAEDLYRQLTAPLRILPDFLIIGVQKGGTTSLYSYLMEHPSILPPRTKEVQFFVRYYQKGSNWYRGQFPTVIQKYYLKHVFQRDCITGESSTENLFYPHTARKVAQLLPRAKIIALLRNPVDRAYSQYRHNTRRGREPLSFEEALDMEEARTREERERVQGDPNYFNLAYQQRAYKARGIYADQLQPWLNAFPKEQILLIKSEDFFTDTATFYQEVLRFLGVPVMLPGRLREGFKAHHVSTNGPDRMEPATRKRLLAYYEPHNARLYQLLGREFAWDH